MLAQVAEAIATPGVDWGALLPFLLLVGGAALRAVPSLEVLPEVPL